MDPRSKHRDILRKKMLGKKPRLVLEETKVVEEKPIPKPQSESEPEQPRKTEETIKPDDASDIKKKSLREGEERVRDTEIEIEIETETEAKLYHIGYRAHDILEMEQSIFSSLEPETRIHICVYRIVSNENTSLPLLQYLFYKSPRPPSTITDNNEIRKREIMFFPYIKVGDSGAGVGAGATAETTQDEKDVKIQQLFGRIEKEVYNITKIKTKPEYVGHLRENRDIYVFYNYGVVSSVRNDGQKMLYRRNTSFWWGLIDEIVNEKHLVNFTIKQNISDLFIKHSKLCFLYASHTKPVNYYASIVLSGDSVDSMSFMYQVNDVTIVDAGAGAGADADAEPDKTQHSRITKTYNLEVPTVGYHGSYHTIIPKIAYLGLQQSTYNTMMGPYYYFGTYRKGVRYAGWTSDYKPREIRDDDGKMITIGDFEGRYERGGMVRFAIFLGKMKSFLNHPYDRKDYSDIVKERIKKYKHNKKWEERTVRMHDHDGRWATEYIDGNGNTYDSVYVGKALLDSGKVFMANPEFIVKSHSQQFPLSFHYLDKTTLQRNWENDYQYYYIE